MAQEIKFTSDGKKVVVLGNLNSQEKIVQEIFVVDGSEIPSGEHFVVKTLHDAPAVSWKESELKKLEEEYQRKMERYENEINSINVKYNKERKELRSKLEYIGLALKNANEKSFETLVDFITGEIRWIVVGRYDFDLIPINEFKVMYEDKLRLISLFGKDDGTFTYAIGEYHDCSGGNIKFYPFKNYDDALEKLKELVIGYGVCNKTINLAIKFGFELPKDDVDEYKKNQISELNEQIENHLKTIDDLKKRIEVIAEK